MYWKVTIFISEEITRLTLKDVDLENGTIYIKRGRKLKNRTLELHRTQHNLLNQYVTEIRPILITEDSDKLIIGKRGTHITVDGIHSIFDQFSKLYPDRKLNPQTIRQSTISYWINEMGYNLEDVQDLAGHKYPSATQAYKSLDVEDSQKWINTFHPLG